MTKQEALKTAQAILLLVDNAYPAFKPESKEMSVRVYAMAFMDSGLSYADIEAGARRLISGGSEYAPSAASIINAAKAFKEESDKNAYYGGWSLWLDEHEQELLEAPEEEKKIISEAEQAKANERWEKIQNATRRRSEYAEESPVQEATWN